MTPTVSRHFVPCPLRNLPLRTRKLPVRTNVPTTSYQKATSSYQRSLPTTSYQKKYMFFFLISSLLVDMFVMLYIICRPICIDNILQIGNYSESSEINMSLSQLFRRVYYEIYIDHVFVKVMYLCVYFIIYCINTLFNSLHHILSTIYKCKTSSFKFDI